MSSKAPKNHSAYRITASDVEQMPVGKVVIDKGNRLIGEWTLMDFATGESTRAVGERVARLCAMCRVKHKKAANLGHPGECGPDAPKLVLDDTEADQ